MMISLDHDFDVDQEGFTSECSLNRLLRDRKGFIV